MPIAKTSIERSNFTRGLVTEASALTFPENSAIDLSNFELNRDGSLNRRLGFTTEALGTDIDIGRSSESIKNYAIKTFAWKSVGNNPALSVGVVQIGTRLWFVDLFADNLSRNLLNKDANGVGQPLDLNDDDALSLSGNSPLSFSSVNGVLIVASAEMDYPVYIEYNGENETNDQNPFNISPIRIKVRDLWGVFDGLEVSERPASLSTPHRYNLYNQGWQTTGNGRPTKHYNTKASRGRPLGEIYPDLFEGPNSTGMFKTIISQEVETRDYKGRTRNQEVWLGGTEYQARQIERLIRDYAIDLGSFVRWRGAPFVGSRYPEITGLTPSRTAVSTTGYPSNSDLRLIGNGTNKDGDPDFQASRINLQGVTTTPAPKGHFIIDAFKRNKSRRSQARTSFSQEDEEQGNISVVTTFANRVFYSGISSNILGKQEESPDYTGCVFFSRNITNLKDLNECYQQADPTAEDDNVLVTTDGGFIKIAEASNIVEMVTVRSNLVVFAENGVWAISGKDGVFTATDYSINQITNVGCSSADSIVVAEDLVYFWSDGGIYVLSSDQISGELNAQNITETTIQSFYNDISDVGRSFAKGKFDSVNRKISWLYNNDDDYDGVSFRHSYNKELVFDTVLGAFYPRSIGTSSEGRQVAAFMETESFVIVNDIQDVVVNGEPVVVNGEQVVVATAQPSKGETVTKYLTLSPTGSLDTYQFTFASYENVDFLDWGETDSPAHLVTGYELGGDTQRNKQVVYMTAHFNRTEKGFDEVDGELEADFPSGCKVQAQWDFSNSVTSGKWGKEFQAYRLNRNYIPSGDTDDFDYGYSVISTKTKVRGSGRAVSFKINTESGKDCQLLGWGLSLSGGSSV
jgi:hypothetical protein